ncbi:putative cartilage oligomeric matrix protein-like [Homarus americanus]|uniref:Putative cartilage oligomeric matrix protein-like n=1 Tax=Homarus americanus TaxID=6706 RepID=A0A8J5NEZ0_HOMAM|nr:putative cartilage oligomeric matrix protein-like [Homarus americanus]
MADDVKYRERHVEASVDWGTSLLELLEKLGCPSDAETGEVQAQANEVYTYRRDHPSRTTSFYHSFPLLHPLRPPSPPSKTTPSLSFLHPLRPPPPPSKTTPSPSPSFTL